MDVDIVLAMDGTNLQRFLDVAKTSSLRLAVPVQLDALAQPELIEQWHREKGRFVFSLRGAEAMATVLDVLVKSVIAFAELWRDAVMVEVGTISISVASIEHYDRDENGYGVQ